MLGVNVKEIEKLVDAKIAVVTATISSLMRKNHDDEMVVDNDRNDLLNQLIDEQKRTNELLSQLLNK